MILAVLLLVWVVLIMQLVVLVFDFINSECGIYLIRRLAKMKEITDHEWPQAMIILMLAVKNAKDTHASYDLIDV